MATVETATITAEEFARMPDNGCVQELVRGEIIEMPPPKPRHGEVCANTVLLVGGPYKAAGLGRVLDNDAGFITERDPDSVRGADVALYSYKRIPKGPLPQHYLELPPDVTFEVRSKDDRLPDLLAKVAECLRAGVQAVCVLDPIVEPPTLTIYTAVQPPVTLAGDDEFTLPEILGDLRVAVRRFFEA